MINNEIQVKKAQQAQGMPVSLSGVLSSGFG
jgi:hypothetical protein